MLYVLNALPNSLLPEAGKEFNLRGISEQEAAHILKEEVTEFTSAVGFESTSDVLTKRLGIEIPYNRINVEPAPNDVLLIAAFTPNRRLEKGELFTEEEILGFPIKYCLIGG